MVRILFGNVKLKPETIPIIFIHAWLSLFKDKL